MHDFDPSHASPLTLPPAHLTTAHHDSEEALQYERHRIAQELDTIPRDTVATSHTNHRSTGTTAGFTTPNQEQHISNKFILFPLIGFFLSQYKSIVKFWTSHINVAIEEGAHRDHLALERTFLGYLRTSLALAMAGVLTAQLFHLQRSVSPNPTIGFFVMGIPLSATFIGFGMLVLLVGAYRFWLQQNAMMRGKVYAGGWDINCVMILSILICTVVFVLVTTIDIMKSYF
ncbi:hypothetical protein DM02DRAFT_589349 [Periconia macrospinosa]|uniref:DUF202 domain-containing protein n=1 Tax=Periconia macrospinosa TaxID=97972 RepID=A0A2V1DX15_9PLEO|nr:hypothetical protein DM02DRAFT_589349 [Periconia macrospinosa]